MAFEQRDNSGSLFRNENKQTDNHPDHNGSVKINGVDYWINAWVKESSSGKRYFSLSFKPKDGNRVAPSQRSAPQPAAQKPQASKASGSIGDLESDIPFAPIERRSLYII